MGNGVAEELLAEAASAEGLDDFGDDWFRGPLEAWSADLTGDQLTDAGRRFFRSLAITDLRRRLRVIDTLNRHPEIDDVTIPPIVYITGLERSGTTLLHNVLARHRLAKPLLRWELMQPVPPPDAATAATDPRIADVQARADKMRGTLLERMHWVNATEPEECHWGFIDFVSLLGGAAGGAMHRWSEFVNTADFTTVLENYRRLLKLLLWKNPPPPGGFLVLKCPQVSDDIVEVASVLPEARFVIPERDPYRVLVSVTAMVSDLLDPFVTDATGQSVLTSVDRIERTYAAITRCEQEAAAPLVHVAYSDVVGQPAAVASDTLTSLGFAPDDGLGDAIARFHDEQRGGARKAPPSELPPIELSRDEVMARPEIARYCERHGIAEEVTRLTGAHSPA